ncbi:MAG: sigma-54-dependent transcriptional regulator [Terriglobia bacterium]
MPAPSPKPNVGLVAEDAAFRRELESSLGSDFNLAHAKNYDEGYALLEQNSLDALVLDVNSGGNDVKASLELLEALDASDIDTLAIVISADQRTQTALRMIRAGAYDYLVTPVNPAVLKVVIERAVEKVRIERENRLLRQEISRKAQVGDLLGSTDAMRDLFDSIKRVARSNATVAIRGESGSGKELVARAIHDQSPRRDRAFVSVNCAALPETLMESELFGYEKGAFTGATATKEGRIEAAHHGTLFLDEIGTLGLSLQSKLLRILEDQTLMRLGGKKPLRVDFRLVTATNEDLEKAVKEGRFREDLYYRIHVVPLFVPPLRERAHDIPLLVEYFVNLHCVTNRFPPKRVDEDAMQALKHYPWPGNVRELENVIQRVVVMTEGDVITLGSLSRDIRETVERFPHEKLRLPPSGVNLEEEVAIFEKQLIELAISRAQGVKAHAARLLGLNKERMKYLCRKYSI